MSTAIDPEAGADPPARLTPLPTVSATTHRSVPEARSEIERTVPMVTADELGLFLHGLEVTRTANSVSHARRVDTIVRLAAVEVLLAAPVAGILNVFHVPGTSIVLKGMVAIPSALAAVLSAGRRFHGWRSNNDS